MSPPRMNLMCRSATLSEPPPTSTNRRLVHPRHPHPALDADTLIEGFSSNFFFRNSNQASRRSRQRPGHRQFIILHSSFIVRAPASRPLPLSCSTAPLLSAKPSPRPLSFCGNSRAFAGICGSQSRLWRPFAASFFSARPISNLRHLRNLPFPRFGFWRSCPWSEAKWVGFRPSLRALRGSHFGFWRFGVSALPQIPRSPGPLVPRSPSAPLSFSRRRPPPRVGPSRPISGFGFWRFGVLDSPSAAPKIKSASSASSAQSVVPVLGLWRFDVSTF